MAAAVASGHDYGMGAVPEMRGEPRSDQRDFQQIVLSCNKDGMDLLRNGQYKQAFEQLKYAESLLISRQGEDEPTNLMAVMCNNLGCYYKKVGKLHAALSYLRKALKIEVSLHTDDVTVAGTHLNICAILSKLDKHDKAVQHAACALDLINGRVASTGDAVTQDEYSVLAIAYHNVAVERDYMHQWDEAAAAYQQGHLIAKRCLGDQHPLTQTLGKNRDAALQKSQKYGKERPAQPPPAPAAAAAAPALPEISVGSGPHGKEDAMPVPRNAVHQEAAEWVQSEETSWRPTPSGLPPVQQAPALGQFQRLAPAPMMPPRPMQASSSLAAYPPPPPAVLESQQVLGSTADSRSPWTQPSHLDAVAQDVPSASAGLAAATPAAPPPSPPPLVVMGRERRPKVKDDKPEAAADAAQGQAQARQRARAPAAPTEGRPPRGAGGRPRREASRSLTRANASGQDSVSAGGTAGQRPQHSQLLRRSAAEKIQSLWREKHRKKLEGKDRSAKEHAAATMIQARWRAFHVRRKKLNKACTTIQKWVRGFLVRLVVRRHNAAVVLQRHAAGMVVRRRLLESNRAATQIQKRLRGVHARQLAKDYLQKRMKAAMVLQRGARMWKAKLAARGRRSEKLASDARAAAAQKIQSVVRGNRGRRRAAQLKAKWTSMLREVRAATRIQAAVRRCQATAKVEAMRQTRLDGMNAAATTIRKHWLRHLHRGRFLELRKEFQTHTSSIVTIQRYVRGYIVRLRMWRDAIRAEEELWAAVEIQRCWRGYRGRLRWELEYEAVRSREEAARRLQRYVRGWLARTRVQRLRKRIARSEFEKARRRFKGAQRIQASVRGHQARGRIAEVRARKVEAAVTIQRMYRGHQMRCKLWNQVVHRRTVQIQAVARGFLVRNRRLRLLAQVINIQRHYRHWLHAVPRAERSRRVQEWQCRRKEARACATAGAHAAEELSEVPPLA